jgi:hypothetical protein
MKQLNSRRRRRTHVIAAPSPPSLFSCSFFVNTKLSLSNVKTHTLHTHLQIQQNIMVVLNVKKVSDKKKRRKDSN